MNSRELTSQLKARAGELGFTLSGSCPAVEPTGISRFREWLERGYAGQMQYLPDRAAAYEHPRSVLDGVRSLL
ncbi:MAG: epoxyqueuosine reductase, partial [Planctomycetales bacterium]|nr:epoxyqueuosine reductase [Planctomycetales bacterium]